MSFLLNRKFSWPTEQGTGGDCPPPQYFANPKNSRVYKQRHINQCIEIWLKYVHSSVDIGNHRYTCD